MPNAEEAMEIETERKDNAEENQKVEPADERETFITMYMFPTPMTVQSPMPSSLLCPAMGSMPTAILAEALCFPTMRRLWDGCLDRKKSKRGEYFKYDRKKLISIMTVGLLAASLLTGCGSGKGENSTVNGEAVGRVRAVADMIQSETGGELFSIQTSVVYPADGGELIDYAAEEQDADARPELTSHIENLEDYDVILSVILPGGEIRPTSSLLLWKAMISAERQSYRSVHREGAGSVPARKTFTALRHLM